MRLVTRADFDGLACSVILDYAGIVDLWEFVHPTDVQNNKVSISGDDIIANLPYVKGCRMWFDHHSSETRRLGKEFFEEHEVVMARQDKSEYIPTLGFVAHEGAAVADYETVKVSYAAPSCARVVYDYYAAHGCRLERFAEMVRFVDKVDSGDLSEEELRAPSGWVLFGLIMDPRTQLEKVKKYRIGIRELTENLSHALRDLSIEEILALPDVRERVEAYAGQEPLFRQTVAGRVRLDGNVIVLDLRGLKSPPAGNRFALYSMYPEQNISVTVMDGSKSGITAIAVGYSIINKTATIDVGDMLLAYHGGGHKKVGSCSVPRKEADRVVSEIVAACKRTA